MYSLTDRTAAEPFSAEAVRDSPLYDSFSKLRVTTPETIFDSKLVVDSAPLLWNNYTTGTATVSHNTNTASATLAVNATGEIASRRTKRPIPYEPGKSQLLMATGVVSATAGIRSEVGLFSDNDGLFFRHSESGIWSVVVRSSTSGSVVDTVIAQENWNLVQPTLNANATQLFVIDFAWLGVHGVRFGLGLDGSIVYVHQIPFCNLPGMVVPFMKSPNLPVCYRVEAISNVAGSISQICSTVISEGGYVGAGAHRAINRGTTGAVNITSNIRKPIISVRVNPNFLLYSSLVPLNVSVGPVATNDFYWELLLNPIITGGAAASWISLTNSVAQYDLSRTGTISDADRGLIIASGYFNGGQDIDNVFTIRT
mgnify:CR=1 FL=1